jgi:hypothetical protein
MCHRPTGFFISKLLNFLEQITSLDDLASRRIGEPVLTFPRLLTDLFPVILNLSFDVSDPQSLETLNAYPNAIEDYIEMFDSLASLLQNSLLLYEVKVLPHILVTLYFTLISKITFGLM